MNQIQIIVNNGAGTGKAFQVWNETQKLLRRYKVNYTAYATRYRGHATRLAEKISTMEGKAQVYLIVVGGGTAGAFSAIAAAREGLKVAVSSEDSKAINENPEPKVILSASGMCEAGRIRHHLKHNLWRKESTVLFVGYQAEGTLGRRLYDGEKHVKLFGEDIEVNCEIGFLPGKSGHADRDGLTAWLAGFEKKPKLVFVNHGEDAVTDAFAGYLETEHGYKAFAPYSGTVFDLAEGKFLVCPKGVPVKKAETASGAKASGLYQKLVAAGESLLSLIRASRGKPNKTLKHFLSDVEELLKKYR